jgi:hypothetical protein
MTEASEIEPELGPEEEELGRRLVEQRPAPGAGFRGALARHLGVRDPGYGPRPGRRRLTVTAYAAAGAGLTALGALVALGVL